MQHRLRHRITIEAHTITRDEWGGAIETWTPLHSNVPAEVVPLSGREFVAASAEQAGVTARITVRYLSDITEAMRIVFDGATYNIRAILPDPTARRHLTIMVETGVRE